MTVIARLLIDEQGVLLQGELADVEAESVVRFASLEGLTEAMTSFLARQAGHYQQTDQ